MASGQWNDDVAYAMTPFKLISWPIGVWPLQIYNIYSLMRCVLATCCSAFMFLMPSIEFFLGCTDMETNVDCLMIVGCATLGMVKTIWFRIYAKNLTHNYSSAVNDYLTIENAKERAIMRKYTFMGRALCSLILSFAYISTMMYALVPFLDFNEIEQVNITNEDKLEYPIPSKCALKYFNVPVSMYRTFCLIETVAIMVACTNNIGNDVLFLNIVLHICGQIEILKNNFHHFDVKSPQIYDRFNVLIKRHNYLIKLTRELTEIISFVLLAKLFIISILLCIIGLKLILALKMNDIVMITKAIIVQTTFLTQLTLYCFTGNHLKSQMEEIGIAVYQSTWYNLPTKLAKHLNFIIMRSYASISLQAGNFIVINLTTYVGILKTSLSYLSVLRILVEA
ncbi:hypothetical protein P5V15_005561 [Pogonomyrmex californicus]